MAAATFPIPLPMHRLFTEASFEPNRRQSIGLQASGNDFVADRGVAQWTLQLKTRTLLDLEMGLWKAWRASLRGLGRYFLAYDPRREFPAAYMPQGWPIGMVRYDGSSWNGTCTLASLASSALAGGQDLVGLSHLPSGFKLSPNDCLSVTNSAGRVSLHQVLDGGVATALGALTVWVEPEIPTAMVTGLAVNLYRACGKFRVTKFDAPVTAEGGARVGAVTLEALSVNL